MDHLLAQIILIGGALGVLFQWVFRPAWRAIRIALKTVNYLSGEMKRNSGTTMRDAIDRLEAVNVLFAQHLGVEIPDHLLPRKGSHPDDH